MNFFGLGPSVDIEFKLNRNVPRKASVSQQDAADSGKQVEKKPPPSQSGAATVPQSDLIYYDGEDVSGTVYIKLKKLGTRLEHQGIRLEFVGQIELHYERSNHHEFQSLSKLLMYPGEISENLALDFNFQSVDKPFESYNGVNVRLRYFLRLTIIKRISNIVKEEDIHVHALSAYPDTNSSIKMEVGIEDCLHIEFEYNKSKYHLKDVIIGKIYFLLVRIKIKYMELAIIKRETSGTGQNVFTESETVAKYEIMDGAPVKGESIPIRLFLGAYLLSPTMKDIQRKFSVKYYLNLVLVDEEERRYFKQQEITLWRKAEQYKSKLERSNQMQIYELSLQDQANDNDGRNQKNVRHNENGDLIDENN